MKRNLVNLLLMYGLLTLMCSVAWATPYEFTFTGDQLIDIDYTADRYELGSRMLTTYSIDSNGDLIERKYYSDDFGSDLATNTQFSDLKQNGWALVDFNFDETNSPAAQGWGQNESFTILSAQVLASPGGAWYVDNQGGMYQWKTDDFQYALYLNDFVRARSAKFSFVADISDPAFANDPTLTLWFGGAVNHPYRAFPNNFKKYEGAIQVTGNPATPSSVPEPATLVLLGVAFSGLFFARREEK